MTSENAEKTLATNEDHRVRELEQEVEIMGEYISLMRSRDASKKTESQDTKLNDNSLKTKESEQEKLILQEINKELKEKNELDINKLLSMISHELRTPLVPIKAYANMLEEEKFGPLTKSQKQKIKAIDENARELIQFITNMIEYQKFSRGKVKPEKEFIDIKKIIYEAHTFFSSEFDSRGMTINSTFSNPLFIMCDPQQMLQVFTNLLQVSLYCVPEKSGKIVVNVWEKEKEVQITVSHNGKNIPKKELEKIFSKFYELDMSNIRSNGGIGLSLSLCKQIIEAHGGKIWYEDKGENLMSISFSIPIEKQNLMMYSD